MWIMSKNTTTRTWLGQSVGSLPPKNGQIGDAPRFPREKAKHSNFDHRALDRPTPGFKKTARATSEEHYLSDAVSSQHWQGIFSAKG